MIELIIIDDCSTDGSVEIMRTYEAKYSVCKVVRNESNLGLGSSRYVGLNTAQGEYLVYVDADDWIDEAFSGKIHEKIQKQRIGYCLEDSLNESIGDRGGWLYWKSLGGGISRKRVSGQSVCMLQLIWNMGMAGKLRK